VSRGEPLFRNHDLRAGLEQQLGEADKAVEALCAKEVSPEAAPSTLDGLERQFSVAPLEVIESETTVENEEARVDVSRDPLRDIVDRSRPAYVAGYTVRYHVPYRGDKGLWYARPGASNLNLPRAEISDSEIVLEFTIEGPQIAQTKSMYEAALANIKWWLDASRQDVDRFNQQLRPRLESALVRRRDRLAQAASQVAQLGLPAREAPSTSVGSPEGTPRRRNKSRGASSPEPTPKDYDVALSFAGEDREYVERVATLLRESGIKVFYDRFETAQLWGRNLADHLGEVYGQKSRFVVLFISQHYPAKAWPTHERQSAQARAIRENKLVLLPARFDDAEIPGLPSTVAYIDLRHTTPEELVALIVAKLDEDA